MAVKEFTVGTSHTVNLGDYNSLRIEASVTMEGSINDVSLTEAQNDLAGLLKNTFDSQAKPPWISQIRKRI